jgi:hypothetical protein
MLIVYDPATGEIVGHASRVFDNGQWREATIEELFPRRDRTKLEALYLKDDPRYLHQGAQHYRIRRDESGVVVGVEAMPAAELSCDADDQDEDGVPDLPADGKATTKITAKLDGGPNIDVTFRTTAGTLSRRRVRTGADGKATVELRASGETIVASITATAAGYRAGAMQIEFIPQGPAPR